MGQKAVLDRTILRGETEPPKWQTVFPPPTKKVLYLLLTNIQGNNLHNVQIVFLAKIAGYWFKEAKVTT